MSTRCPRCERVAADHPAQVWFYCGRCGEGFQRSPNPAGTDPDAAQGLRDIPDPTPADLNVQNKESMLALYDGNKPTIDGNKPSLHF